MRNSRKMTKKQLRELIREDREYYFGNLTLHIGRILTHNPVYHRGKYIITCRKVGYYSSCHDTILGRIQLWYYKRKKNKLGERLGIELGPNEFGRRLRIYHNNIVINAGAIIGNDCELYGNNCIGNKGSASEALEAPIIGDNVSFGVGANAIGRISICDHVQVSSMSLVNKNITEAGLYGGVPAQMIRSKT